MRRPLLAFVVTALVAVLGLTLAPAATAAPAYPPGQLGQATINRTVFKPGATVVVKVVHTTPGTLTMQIFPAPVQIGTGTVGRGGRGVVRGVIPAGYSGDHTIQVVGAGGEVYPFAITVKSGGGA